MVSLLFVLHRVIYIAIYREGKTSIEEIRALGSKKTKTKGREETQSSVKMIKMGVKKTHEHESGFFEDNILSVSDQSRNKFKAIDNMRRHHPNQAESNSCSETSRCKIKPATDSNENESANLIVIDSDDEETDDRKENGSVNGKSSHKDDDIEIVSPVSKPNDKRTESTDDDVVEVPLDERNVNNNRNRAERPRNGERRTENAAAELMREIEAASTIRPQGKCCTLIVITKSLPNDPDGVLHCRQTADDCPSRLAIIGRTVICLLCIPRRPATHSNTSGANGSISTETKA